MLLPLAVTVVSYSVPIGGPPTKLAKLIDMADAIVILRIDRHLSGFGSDTFYSTHECFIYQSIKGDIPKGTRIKLQLMDTEGSFATPYAWGSTHLMFLIKKAAEDEPTEYRTLTVNGAQVLLSPLGHEKPPEGKTIEEKVKNLIKDAILYQAKEHEKKQKFLKAMIGEQSVVAPIEPSPTSRVNIADLQDSVAIAVSSLHDQASYQSNEYVLTSAQQIVVKGKYVWRITFKPANLLPKDPSKGLIGAGGETFVYVDLNTKKTEITYGE